jgi:hypothetical protein
MLEADRRKPVWRPFSPAIYRSNQINAGRGMLQDAMMTSSRRFETQAMNTNIRSERIEIS